MRVPVDSAMNDIPAVNPVPRISFSWDLHWECNYRCPYCWWHGRWEQLAPRNVYPGTESVVRVWKGIHERYGETHIEIAGGEPSLYPDFPRVLEGLLAYHTVGIMTNLSGDWDTVLRTVPAHLLARLKIGATYHPLFGSLDDFLRLCVIIRKRGMSLGVLYLAYPPQIERIPVLKKLFADNDIYFSVSTFWGTYNGKEYPASYTEQERAIIGGALGERTGEKFQTKPLVTAGRLCHAGHRYGIIHPNGEVLPCGGGSWKGENIIIGNLFDGSFALWDAPRPCFSEHCPCNEWAFLLVDKPAREDVP